MGIGRGTKASLENENKFLQRIWVVEVTKKKKHRRVRAAHVCVFSIRSIRIRAKYKIVGLPPFHSPRSTFPDRNLGPCVEILSDIQVAACERLIKTCAYSNVTRMGKFQRRGSGNF